MKFCKALQKVAESSDPTYRPYWTNYKQLKKLIKAIAQYDSSTEGPIDFSCDQSGNKTPSERGQFHKFGLKSSSVQHKAKTTAETTTETTTKPPQGKPSTLDEHRDVGDTKAHLQQSPGEVAFFQLLHSELGKASEFFGKTEKQFIVREEIVRVGMEVLKRPQAATVKDRWSVLSKAVFMLYRDLLVLETFAIMTYFAFQKILKKHDKVTGYDTREPFMINVVHKAPFTNYPRTMEMIGRCQSLYNDASQRLFQGLYEDENLFLHMIQTMQQPNLCGVAMNRPKIEVALTRDDFRNRTSDAQAEDSSAAMTSGDQESDEEQDNLKQKPHAQPNGSDIFDWNQTLAEEDAGNNNQPLSSRRNVAASTHVMKRMRLNSQGESDR